LRKVTDVGLELKLPVVVADVGQVFIRLVAAVVHVVTETAAVDAGGVLTLVHGVVRALKPLDGQLAARELDVVHSHGACEEKIREKS
jgi:hypothetical protein